MTNGAIIWLIIFALAAAVFFAVAAIVTVKGFADLRALLRHSGRKVKPRGSNPAELSEAPEAKRDL